MRLFVNLFELKTRVGVFKFTVLVFLCLLLMTYFGYQLAGLNFADLRRNISQLEQTNTVLRQENESLTSERNQLEVQLAVAEQTVELHREKVKLQLIEMEALTEQLAFYQRVVAPETNAAGVTVESVEIQRYGLEHRYHLRLVMIRSGVKKVVHKGTLEVTLSGKLGGQPHHFVLPNDDNQLRFGFSYFQVLNADFSLPNEFKPDTLSITGKVFRYKTRVGEVDYQAPWNSFFTPDGEQPSPTAETAKEPDIVDDEQITNDSEDGM